jgi:hypothetical protein
MVQLRLFVAILCCWSFAVAQEFKAQHGWGLPSRLATTSITQGVVLDLTQKRLIVAETAGLEAQKLNGNKTMLLEQVGTRALTGIGTGKTLSLAWYRRSASSQDGVWWWHQNQAKFAFDTPYTNFALLLIGQKPVLIAAVQQNAETILMLQTWGQKPQAIYRTALNIGALAAANIGQRIGVIFAEGYRNAQDEKYDLRLLELGQPAKTLAPAVYVGREQQYFLAVKDNQFAPVWWYETLEEQRFAAFTKQHNPRLALWDKGNIIEFAPPQQIIGQVGSRIFYSGKNRISSFDFSRNQTRLEVLAPDSLTTVFMAGQNLAWQSLNPDGFSSELWFVDAAVPFVPNTLDQVSAMLGWNPWYPWQNLFGQTALSLILAVMAVVLVAPVVWLLRGRFDWGQSAWFGLGFACLVLLVVRFFGGNAAVGNWVFAPLLQPPWLAVLLGLGLGSLVVWLNRKKLNGSELGATISSSLVVLIGVFVMMFSRVGFLQF